MMQAPVREVSVSSGSPFVTNHPYHIATIEDVRAHHTVLDVLPKNCSDPNWDPAYHSVKYMSTLEAGKALLLHIGAVTVQKQLTAEDLSNPCGEHVYLVHD